MAIGKVLAYNLLSKSPVGIDRELKYTIDIPKSLTKTLSYSIGENYTSTQRFNMSDKWQRFEYEFTSSSTMTEDIDAEINFYLNNGNTGTVWLDGVQIESVDVHNPQNEASEYQAVQALWTDAFGDANAARDIKPNGLFGDFLEVGADTLGYGYTGLTKAIPSDFRAEATFSLGNSFETGSDFITFRFDGNIAIQDPDNVWTNDGYAFDDDPTYTAAEVAVSGTNSSNHLVGKGTNAVSNGATIVGVQVQFKSTAYDNAGGIDMNMEIYAEGGTELLGTVVNTSEDQATGKTSYWSPKVSLSTPTGGWTWDKVSKLESVTYIPPAGSNISGKLYIAEVTVEYEKLVSPTTNFRIVYRSDSSTSLNNGYMFDANMANNTWELKRLDAGVETSIGATMKDFYSIAQANTVVPDHWNTLTIVADGGWHTILINDTVVVSTYDNTYLSDSASEGYFIIGSGLSNTKLVVDKLRFPHFWQPVPSLTLNSSDDGAKKIAELIESGGGTYYLNANEKLVVKKLKKDDKSIWEFTADDLLENDYSISDKEVFNESVVYGWFRVRGQELDLDSIRELGGKFRSRVVTDEKLIGQYAVDERAESELESSKVFLEQPDFKIMAHPGLEIYDVIYMSDSHIGLTTRTYRIFTINKDYQASDNSFTQSFGIGEVTGIE